MAENAAVNLSSVTDYALSPSLILFIGQHTLPKTVLRCYYFLQLKVCGNFFSFNGVSLILPFCLQSLKYLLLNLL